MGPPLIVPAFHGGRLRARIRLEEARQRTVALAWRCTVLNAPHQVKNALATSYGERDRREAPGRQAAALARQHFAPRSGNVLEALGSERTRLSAGLAAESAAQASIRRRRGL
ncbi:MAG: hypothetical protein ICV73_14930 [Acetobacteraceae bacterium]|nr:hypothetical protein [Acetobacteraceae bacterium]